MLKKVFPKENEKKKMCLQISSQNSPKIRDFQEQTSNEFSKWSSLGP